MIDNDEGLINAHHHVVKLQVVLCLLRKLFKESD